MVRRLFELKVTLLDVEPVVWRAMTVADDMPLYEVGAAIVGAMGWHASHMFAFEFEGGRYDIKFDDELDLEDSLDMAGVLASDVLSTGIRFGFQYDFGDDWWHEVEVVAERPIATGDKPPRCLAGENACPPDDSGGPPGFEAMLEALADPDDPEHDEIKDWLGDWKPSDFNVERANKAIRKAIKAYTT